MASIAQVAAQRRRQAAAIKQALRQADSAGEVLERKLKTYTNKRRMIEAKDLAPLNALYRDYTSKVGLVEKQITALATLTSA